jgi:hypothetical protein
MPVRHADRQLQCNASTMDHSPAIATECSVASDKTRRAHTIEDIICYS